jgi:hypothetical protein
MTRQHLDGLMQRREAGTLRQFVQERATADCKNGRRGIASPLHNPDPQSGRRSGAEKLLIFFHSGYVFFLTPMKRESIHSSTAI